LEHLSRLWETAQGRQPDRATGTEVRQQTLEIDFLKECLQCFEEGRMLRALTGKPGPPATFKSKSNKGGR
jgi:hypothetical protein